MLRSRIVKFIKLIFLPEERVMTKKEKMERDKKEFMKLTGQGREIANIVIGRREIYGEYDKFKEL